MKTMEILNVVIWWAVSLGFIFAIIDVKWFAVLVAFLATIFPALALIAIIRY